MNKPANSLEITQARDALNEAFEALTTYDRGSSRAVLLPIDGAVAATGGKPELRQQLEKRLLLALRPNLSAPAREYVYSKLALVGGDASATTLALAEVISPTDTALRNALEAIPGPTATKTLLTLL